MNYKENKQVLLTLFITMIMMVTTLFTFGQTTINPDTVCINAIGEQYFVTNTPGSTYQWGITSGGGTVQTGQGSNSITIDWGGVPGLYLNALSVTETNASNCAGIPINLDIYILQVGTIPLGPFCEGDASQGLTGTPVGGTWTGTGVIGNQFDPVTAGTGVHMLTYTYTTGPNTSCATMMNVTVNLGPITGPIQHF